MCSFLPKKINVQRLRQGSACMLCADAYRAMEKYKEAQQSALEVWLFPFCMVSGSYLPACVHL